MAKKMKYAMDNQERHFVFDRYIVLVCLPDRQGVGQHNLP
jgi:hypothetical protein